jgi:hypothetical protein
MSQFGEIQGLDKAMQSLRNLGSEDRIFMRKSLRKAVRAGSKVKLATMRRLAPKDSGTTVKSLAIRSIKKRKYQMADIVGIFGKKWDAAKKIYAGWMNWGHKTRKSSGSVELAQALKRGPESKSGKAKQNFVEGRQWIADAKLDNDLAQDVTVQTLKAEIEGREWIAK